ncbi:NADH dehydrogenase [ubiquinone] 1 beta subcomplex subunit 2, mitochondrial [Diachasma alloeum]|uniref:AGGG subunit, NADH-dehydrogenase n=1 Tax=Diachasma alloeum TaxID=454923 RepID=A0A4E0S3N2_9HYME|nr:NADH dehydrogenase [ubiquinone] 1 beta subcomplex subunit 2, mitochondrial [Diachasma alloeum]THK32865.1 AGGG subunit, NADH-dehydrogenase [Diachasma alloeum]
MLISRGVGMIKNVTAFASQTRAPMKTQVRHSGGAVMYRDVLEPARCKVYLAEFFGGIMWWWILWHMWHDWGHIVGEFPYPEPEKWTDEELGIPPDDADV